MSLSLNNIISFCWIVIFTSACSVTKEYSRPELPSISQYRGIENQDTSTIGNYAWKDFFKDDILIRLIEEGLKNNLDILKIQENLKIVNALAKQSKAALWPNIAANGVTGYNIPSTESFQGSNIPPGTEFSDIKIGMNFSWEIDIWGKLRSQKRAAIAQYMQTEKFQNMIKSEIVYGISTNYYILQSLDAKKKIILNNIINREEGIETTIALKESGKLTEVAVKQNEALLYTAQSLLIDVENEIKLRENILSTLLGKVPQQISRNKLSDQEILGTLNIGIPIQLLSNRPDVLVAEYGLINAFEITNVAYSSFYPSLTISGTGGLNSDNFSNLFNANAVFASIAGGLLQPVFAQRQLKTQKEIKLSEQEIALLDYKQVILKAYQEVSNELNTFNANTQKLSIKEKELAVLEKALEFSVELQDQGLANYLEILRAKDNLLNTALSIVDIKTERLVTQSSLYKALGGGWR